MAPPRGSYALIGFYRKKHQNKTKTKINKHGSFLWRAYFLSQLMTNETVALMAAHYV